MSAIAMFQQLSTLNRRNLGPVRYASCTISVMFAFRWLFCVAIAFSVAFGQEDGQPAKDPHRAPCTSAQCREVKSFVKNHYCGAPEGNGPDDSCEIQEPKKH